MDSGRAETVALLQRLHAEWGAEQPSGWDNVTVPQYLDALAGWLPDCDGFYANTRQRVPTDPWQIVRDGLQAAGVYE